MENFTYYNPTRVIFGKNTIPLIGLVLRQFGHKKVLLLAGQGSIKRNGVYDQTAKSLDSMGVKAVEVWGVRPNPALSKVKEAIKAARDKRVSAVLAVGGGSVIDSAKAAAAGFYLRNVWDAFEDKVRITRALPVFTVLTVSGSASEFNQWAVVTNEAEKKKWSVGSEVLFPVVSIIDPQVQVSLPWRQTVYGTVDALAHLMENYFLGTDQEVSMSISEALMRTLMTLLDRLQKRPDDYNARANLVWAAGLAHNGAASAAMRGGDWASHGIQHGVSALHPEVAHGAGLAVIFPAWILRVQKTNPAIFKRWAKNVMAANSVEQAVKNFRKRLAGWHAPVWLSELGIDPKEIRAIAANACLQAPLGRLKKLSLKDVVSVLELCVKKS